MINISADQFWKKVISLDIFNEIKIEKKTEYY